MRYDFKDTETIPNHLHNKFDMVVVDPPFITHDVWSKYAEAVNLLLIPNASAGDNSEAAAASDSNANKRKILVTSIIENAPFFSEHFDATPVKFRPLIPQLVYQYEIFTNFEPTVALHVENPEVDW